MQDQPTQPNSLSSLPPPPQGQTGMTLDAFKHLPPPPSGQQGVTLNQLNSSQSSSSQGGFMDTLLNNPISKGIQSIFPGQKVGEAIGTAAGAIKAKADDLLTGSKEYQNYDLSAPSPLQVGGDIAQGALTVAAPGVGVGESALGRIGANAVLGAGIGGTGAIAEGKGVGDVAKSAVVGGAIGGGAAGLGETGKYLTESMPKWFTQLALPKLGNALKGTPQETVDYALSNTKGATLNKMYSNSRKAISSYENQVQAVLKHPQYANEIGKVGEAIPSIQKSLPNAGLDTNKISGILKQVAPQNRSLVDKVIEGTANLGEQNTLRKELDMATKKAYGDKPTLTFAKSIGKSMADFLRGNVQGTAKETAPIFSEYSKEHALNNALGSALSKKRVAGPLIAGSAGFATGGLKGAASAIAIEEGLRSPTAKLLAGKAIRGIGKVALPVAKTAFQAGKAPLIKSVTQ